MKYIITLLSTLFFLGCSTTAYFKTPPGTQLEVYGRPMQIQADNKVETKPFFWTATAGIPYKLKKNNRVIKSGKLPAKFRVASIFWPPAGIIYWPMGFRQAEYDLR